MQLKNIVIVENFLQTDYDINSLNVCLYKDELYHVKKDSREMTYEKHQDNAD